MSSRAYNLERRCLKAPEELEAHADRGDTWLMSVARFCTIANVAALSRTMLNRLNTTTIKKDAAYEYLIQTIKYRCGSALLDHA